MAIRLDLVRRYDRGANEVPEQNAPPEGRSVYAPYVDNGTTDPLIEADPNGPSIIGGAER
jgi:hypothetical protein